MPTRSSTATRAFLALSEVPRAALDMGALLSTLPLLALAPRGDGHPVLVLPGLGGGDDSTRVLRGYLDQQGFASQPWNLGRNRGLNRLGGPAALLARVDEVATEHAAKVSLVGWSLGGVMARAIARQAPHKIRQVISLGSPIGGAHPPPRQVPSTAIYSESDGVVPAHVAVEAEAPHTDNIRVYSSHIGLGFNPAVFYAVADRLAQGEGRFTKFHREGWRAAVYGPSYDRSLTSTSARVAAEHT